jgi:hypothetical protein
MRRMLLVVALFSAIVVLVGSGCGGDDGTTTSAPGGDTTTATGADEAGNDREATEKPETDPGDGGSATEKRSSAAKKGGSDGERGSSAETQSSAPGAPDTEAAGNAGNAGNTGDAGNAGNAGNAAAAADSLSRTEYLEQGNAACARIQKKMGKEFEGLTEELTDKGLSPTKEQGRKIIARVAIPAAKEQISALRALPAPSGDEEKVALILARQEETLKKIEAEPLFRTSAAYKKLNEPASEYGLGKCAV